ncbi:hypothetical protein ACTA71_005195 [Dictyostelium dimigraforme]
MNNLLKLYFLIQIINITMINCKSFEFKMIIFNNSDCSESGIVSTMSVSPCSDFGLIKFDTENSGIVYDPIYEIKNCLSKLDGESDEVRAIDTSQFEFGKCQTQRTSPRYSKVSYFYSINRNQSIPQKMEGKCNSITFLYDSAQDQINNKPNCNYTKIRSYDNGTCYENPIVHKFEKLMCIGDDIITYRCGNDSLCQDSNCYPFDQFASNSSIYDKYCKNINLNEDDSGSKSKNISVPNNNNNNNNNNNDDDSKDNKNDGRMVNSMFSNSNIIYLNSKLLQLLISISILILILL